MAGGIEHHAAPCIGRPILDGLCGYLNRALSERHELRQRHRSVEQPRTGTGEDANATRGNHEPIRLGTEPGHALERDALFRRLTTSRPAIASQSEPHAPQLRQLLDEVAPGI